MSRATCCYMLLACISMTCLSYASGPAELAEFQDYAEALEQGDSYFYGLSQFSQIENDLASNEECIAMTQEGTPARLDCVGLRLTLLNDLIHNLIRVGDLDESLSRSDEVFALLDEYSALSYRRSEAHFTRATIFLRQSEIVNCIGKANAQCCIFPLKGGGLHSIAGPAITARSEFLAHLALQPNDVVSKWLLNILSMAIGDFPQGVDPAYRIPSSSFVADYDIKPFRNVSLPLQVDTFNLAGGSIVDDFDRDGLMDIVNSTADPRGPLTYYRNLGEWEFEDASTSSGLSNQLGGLNATAADFDDDGDQDLLVLRGGWLKQVGQLRPSLLRNDGGTTFVDVSLASGFADDPYPSQCAAWADFDNDGDLDVYLGVEAEMGGSALLYPSKLLSNDGDGTFTDISVQAGVTNERFTKGVAAGDYDNDGDMDIFVATIGGQGGTIYGLQDADGRNRLYRNNGDGSFTDVAEAAGVTGPDAAFASWFFDFDNDGLLDIFVCAYDASLQDVYHDMMGMPDSATRPALYHNNGDGTFTDIALSSGLDHAYRPMGAGFGDLDNDGWLDVYLTTGTPELVDLMPNVMLRNNAGIAFQDVTYSGGFGHLQKGHGVTFVDIDNDGDQDIYHQIGGFLPSDKFSNALYLNPGHGNHFLYIEAVGVQSNRSGVGARVRVDLATPEGSRSIHRAIGSISSFGSVPNRLEIGLGRATAITSVHVDWPRSGLSSTHEGVALDTMIRVTEGQSQHSVLPLISVNTPPVAEADSGNQAPFHFETTEKVSLDIPVSAVLMNDSDQDVVDVLSVISVAAPNKGQVSFNSGIITFDPANDFGALEEGQTENATFAYTISDGNGGNAVATVTVVVVGISHRPLLAVDFDPPQVPPVLGGTLEVVLTVSHDNGSDGTPINSVVLQSDTMDISQITDGDGDLQLDAGEQWTYLASVDYPGASKLESLHSVAVYGFDDDGQEVFKVLEISLNLHEEVPLPLRSTVILIMAVAILLATRLRSRSPVMKP